MAIATQVTNEARQRLEPALLSHNSDLARAQSAIENLEEEANSAEQTIVRTRRDLVLRERHQKARHDTLESECEHLRKEQRIRDSVCATNLDPYSNQRGAMHEVLTLLDRLFCTRHRSVLAERHVLELRSQSNEKRSLIDVGGGDITHLTLADLSLMSKSSTEADDISTALRNAGLGHCQGARSGVLQRLSRHGTPCEAIPMWRLSHLLCFVSNYPFPLSRNT